MFKVVDVQNWFRPIYIFGLTCWNLRVFTWFFDFVSKGRKRSSSVCSGSEIPLTLKLICTFCCCVFSVAACRGSSQTHVGRSTHIIDPIQSVPFPPTRGSLSFIFLHSHSVVDRGPLRSSICKSQFSAHFSGCV